MVVDFFDAHGLAGEDGAEVSFFVSQTNATASGDHDGFIVGIVDVGQPLVGTCGRLIDLCWALHVQRFVRTLVVEDLHELVEPRLLLQKVGSRGLGGFFFQGQMRALMAAVLLGVARLNPLAANTEPEPPDRECSD